MEKNILNVRLLEVGRVIEEYERNILLSKDTNKMEFHKSKLQELRNDYETMKVLIEYLNYNKSFTV
jgi:hypothetical protein